MIFMSFISSLGISVAVFSIFAVAVVIFWSSVELQLVKISNWIFFLFILCWGLTGICAAFCHREISSGTFTLVFHLCPVLELAFTGTGLAFCWAIFILFWIVFFYRSCLLVADIYLWVAPRIPVSYSSSLTLPLWKRLSWLNQGPTIDSMVLPSLPFHRWEVAVTQLFVMPPQVHPLWSCLHDPRHAQSAHPRETLWSLPQVFFLPKGLQVCRKHHGSRGQPAPSRASQDYSVSVLVLFFSFTGWLQDSPFPSQFFFSVFGFCPCIRDLLLCLPAGVCSKPERALVQTRSFG